MLIDKINKRLIIDIDDSIIDYLEIANYDIEKELIEYLKYLEIKNFRKDKFSAISVSESTESVHLSDSEIEGRINEWANEKKSYPYYILRAYFNLKEIKQSVNIKDMKKEYLTYFKSQENDTTFEATFRLMCLDDINAFGKIFIYDSKNELVSLNDKYKYFILPLCNQFIYEIDDIKPFIDMMDDLDDYYKDEVIRIAMKYENLIRKKDLINIYKSVYTDIEFGNKQINKFLEILWDFYPDYAETFNVIPEGLFSVRIIQSNIIIPYGVTEICKKAFYKDKLLEKIEIPNTVKKIGDEAFYQCEGLKEIAIPNSLIEIGKEAFNYCIKLESIFIPTNVKNIEVKAFANCSMLKKIVITAGSRRIANQAFENCGKPYGSPTRVFLETTDYIKEAFTANDYYLEFYEYRETKPIEEGLYFKYNDDGDVDFWFPPKEKNRYIW